MDSTGCVVQGRINAIENILTKGLYMDEVDKQRLETELGYYKDVLKAAEAYQ